MEKLKETIKKIGTLNEDAMKKAKERQDFLTKPMESLGGLEDLSIKVAGITGNPMPKLKNKVIVTMAGDHGVACEGVSAFPQEVTPQMVYNFVHGGAGINVLARHIGAKVLVVDMGVAADIDAPEVINKKVDYGTKNMAKGAAMTREHAVRSIVAGIEVVEDELKNNNIEILGTGDMGIGNTTPSSAIVSVITKTDVEKITGRGTGIDDDGLKNKIKIIKKAIEINNPDASDPIDVLSKVGGFEIGGLAGVILAGAANRIPVVIDGFISGAAALIATRIEPKTKNFLIASHKSVESGHITALNNIGLEPLIDLNLRLGEGTGAALGINIVDAGCKILCEMATFEDARVSEKNE
ncbi:MAG: nicotinate-nucleotide--dimethylbenzimidazole phosphoribosyltransferase [Candidatus Altiarchaeales archaeon WOR_SM1_86-2]|nr:MAG: nicotinate-nucleotide--dimethylbenzimidazole phosphoribosyltransferase [Candidatus Altiarchaeales archaeon WOR_SM1_86-2]ODS41776.1 MAG: nicotinate-nucleotide--dimethylbenzimidazole phosphoribosyltransferase [Candidatus Altiarchaeales archaeon WOR_SM1_79]